MLPEISSEQHHLIVISASFPFSQTSPSARLGAMRTLLTTLHSKYIHPSLALPYLAAYCQQDATIDCDELLIREFTLHEPKENVLYELLKEQPDVIAFSVYLWNRIATLELVDALHVAAPHVRVILGGPEVSYETTPLWQHHPGIHAIIHGEGEQPLRALLHSWQHKEQPKPIPGIEQRDGNHLIDGGVGPLLETLDSIPSPFESGWMDCERGFVYYETSRGCPYSCAFCMSALDTRVRSFSMERIERDLLWLMEREIPKIKLVDRTFNYDPRRAYHIFSFILKHNRCSHFHFEIGAHLLDEATLELLKTVPDDMFQFEIGIQSTLPETLKTIKRHAPQQQLFDNVRALIETTHVHLHLDLIAGLPGEDMAQMVKGFDQVMALNPDHLQIETVKLLPGAPLRQQAQHHHLVFDPNPPYRVLTTPTMNYNDLEEIRALSRVLDLTWNCGRARNLLRYLGDHYESMGEASLAIARDWQQRNVLRFPLGQKELFEQLAAFIRHQADEDQQPVLLDLLARDCALTERLTPGNAPDFFDLDLDHDQQARLKQCVAEQLQRIQGQGIKLQHFAARFQHLPDREPAVHVFFYLTGSGRKMEVLETILNEESTI